MVESRGARHAEKPAIDSHEWPVMGDLDLPGEVLDEPGPKVAQGQKIGVGKLCHDALDVGFSGSLPPPRVIPLSCERKFLKNISRKQPRSSAIVTRRCHRPEADGTSRISGGCKVA